MKLIGHVYIQEYLEPHVLFNLILYPRNSSLRQNTVSERVATTPPEKQNGYHEGELVLWQRDPTRPLPNKLAPNFKDPYKVISHTNNDVECRHLVIKNVCMFDVSRVKMFQGTEQDVP